MVIVLDTLEPMLVVRGEAARQLMEQVQRQSVANRPAPPRDFAEAMRRVELEVWNAA